MGDLNPLNFVGDIFGAGADYLNARAERDFRRGQVADVNRRVDEYANLYGDWQSGLPVQDLYSAAMAPQTSTGSFDETSRTNMLMAPEVQAEMRPMFDMLKQRYMNNLTAADLVPEGLLETEYGEIAREEQAADEQIENLARSRGVDPRLMKIGGPAMRMGAQARAAARRGAEQERYGRRRAAEGDVAGLLESMKARRQRGTTRRSGTSTQTGGPNISGAIAALGLSKPYEKPIVV
jgi:hypothetical protein